MIFYIQVNTFSVMLRPVLSRRRIQFLAQEHNAVYVIIFYNLCNSLNLLSKIITYEPCHEITNNVVCATNKGSDQSAHTRSLIIAFAYRLSGSAVAQW